MSISFIINILYFHVYFFQFVLVFTFIDFKRTTYGDYEFPIWSDVLGWLITITEIGSIPAVAIYKLYTAGEGLSLIRVCRTMKNVDGRTAGEP